jgi:MFS family permease
MSDFRYKHGAMNVRARRWIAFYAPALLVDLALYANLFALEQRTLAQGGSEGDLSWLAATYIGVYVLSSLVAGRFADTSARDFLLVASGTLMVGAFSLGLWTSEAWQFRATLGGIGVLSAMFWPSVQSKLGDESQADMAGAVGGFNVAWSIGKAAGLFGAGRLFEWREGAPFLLAAAGALVAALCAMATFGGRPAAAPAAAAAREESRDPPRARPGRAGKRAFLIAALSANFLGYGVNALAIALVPKLGASLGLSPTVQGGLLATTVLGQFAGFLLLRHSRAWAYRVGPILAVEALFAAACVPLALARSWPLFLPSLFCYGLFLSVSYASSIFYSLDFDERRGLRTGIHEAALGTGGFVLPLAGALAARAGGTRLPYALAGALVLALAAVHAAWFFVAGRRARYAVGTTAGGAPSTPDTTRDAASPLRTSAEPRT